MIDDTTLHANAVTGIKPAGLLQGERDQGGPPAHDEGALRRDLALASVDDVGAEVELLEDLKVDPVAVLFGREPPGRDQPTGRVGDGELNRGHADIAARRIDAAQRQAEDVAAVAAAVLVERGGWRVDRQARDVAAERDPNRI